MNIVAEGRDEMDDITFCLSDCQRTDCFRHPSNIQDRTIPHSYAEFKGTETCPFAKDINVTINDDTISRKTAIDAMENCEPGEELFMIKSLPSVQPEHMCVNLDIQKIATHKSDFSDLDDLPSVQPDDAALHESCTDCPLYDHDRHSCPRFNKVIPTAIRDAQTGRTDRRCGEGHCNHH